jgi:selenide,water dikinase
MDPQTSGGLLIAVPARRADALVRRLHVRGVTAAARIGYATRRQEVSVRLL